MSEPSYLVFGWRYIRDPFPLCYVATEDEARAECARLAEGQRRKRESWVGRLADPVRYSYRPVWR